MPSSGAAVPEVQVVSLSCDAGSDVAGSTFALSFMGQTTGAIAHDKSADYVRDALQSLTTVGSVTVTQPDASTATSVAWRVTFGAMPASYAGGSDKPEMLMTSRTLQGTNAKGGVSTATHGNALGGTFTLKAGGSAEDPRGVVSVPGGIQIGFWIWEVNWPILPKTQK